MFLTIASLLFLGGHSRVFCKSSSLNPFKSCQPRLEIGSCLDVEFFFYFFYLRALGWVMRQCIESTEFVEGFVDMLVFSSDRIPWVIAAPKRFQMAFCRALKCEACLALGGS